MHDGYFQVIALPVSTWVQLTLRPRARAQRALGDEVEDPALALGVARIPVLDGRIFYLGVLVRVDFDHRGVELVLVAHRRGAAFEVGDVAALFGDDQRALELAGILGVDAEIGRQFHRAAHALGHQHEGAVAEHRGVEAGEDIVALRHDAAEIFLDQLGIFAGSLRRCDRKITPARSNSSRKVVATETLSNTASTATLRAPSTPASTFCSSIGMPSFS